MFVQTMFIYFLIEVFRIDYFLFMNVEEMTSSCKFDSSLDRNKGTRIYAIYIPWTYILLFSLVPVQLAPVQPSVHEHTKSPLLSLLQDPPFEQ